MRIQPPARTGGWFETCLAWYFVTIWGSGFLATKIGLMYAPPFTFLTLRFLLGIVCLTPLVMLSRAPWPATRRDFMHVVVAGLFMHVMHLGGSHYSQYLGISAGIVAVLLTLQPVLTALFAACWMNERLIARQWFGIALGFCGVILIVWHKIDVHEITAGSLFAVCVSLLGATVGTLYQRVYCPRVNLRSAGLIQFAVSAAVLAPLAWHFEGFAVQWTWQMLAAMGFLVIGASILAVNALHTLMRRGAATRVTSLIYLTPIFAVVLEFAMFDIVPGVLSVSGIAVTCAGVALVTWSRPR
jgi:drug/metabolite transporter (DMT)-like permease